MIHLTRASLVASLLLAGPVWAADPQPVLGTKGRLLLEEKFDGEALPNGWSAKAGKLRVADGVLRATQTAEADRLCLFNCDLPMQDAAIQIDFKFDGARGLNVSANPSAGELNKKGHLFSVMVTPQMWNITEHNNKADPSSRSVALASGPESFAQGKWFTLLLETKGETVVAQIEGRKPLRASSKDFAVKKPGIEFRVSGRGGGDAVFDNLKVWELK